MTRCWLVDLVSLSLLNCLRILIEGIAFVANVICMFWWQVVAGDVEDNWSFFFFSYF